MNFRLLNAIQVATLAITVLVTTACGRTRLEPVEEIPPGYVKLVVFPNSQTSDIIANMKKIHFIGDLTVNAALNNNIGEDAVVRAFQNQQIRSGFAISSSTLEGYIVAGTYYVDPKGTASQALRLLLAKSTGRYANKDRLQRANELGLSPRHLLTLASIIQRETCGKEEMPRMASVLYNRLNKSMPLQVDVTLLYLLQRWDGHITKQELKIPSPYNTYAFKGLPPTPIGSPSLDAVDAVLYPDNSAYLFFAASGKCKHFFSENYRDHEDFVARYLRPNISG